MDIKSNSNAITIVTMPTQWTIKNANDDKEILKNFVVTKNANIILDFSQTQFIDSTGLGTLVAILKSCKQNQGNLTLCNLNPKVQTIIELTQLHKIFTIFPTLAQAEASFNV